jgi:tRNA pseudouridine55 synthase
VEIARHAREVEIRELELLSWQAPGSRVAACAAWQGTYIRALAEDIGAALGCGAHLTGLLRTASGGFALADASR